MKRRLFAYLFILTLPACKAVRYDLSYSPSYISVEQKEEDKAVNKIIAPYKHSLDTEMNKVIGKSDMAFPKQAGLPETVLGDLIADLTLAYAKTIVSETDFSVLNNGGLRSSLPQGDITLRNVFELMPFDNEVVILNIKGEEITHLLEYIAGRGGVPVSGLTMNLKRSGSTFVPEDVKIGGVWIDPVKTYRVTTSDYLATGGDSMNFWSTEGMVKTNKKLRDAIIEYIRSKTDKNEIVHTELDNRIRIIE